MPSFWFPDLVSNILRTFVGWGIRLYGATSGSVGLMPPAVAGSVDYVLPGSSPVSNGQSLISSTGGSLSWGGPYAALSGATFTGDVQFSGTGHVGLIANSLTTTQRDALSASSGTVIFNSTTGRMEAYAGGSWQQYVRVSGDTMAGALTISASGAASTASCLLSGTVFTSGTATTTFPMLLFQTGSAAAVTNWNTNGAFIGINADSGFSGYFADFHINGSGSFFRVDSGGAIITPSTITASQGIFSSKLSSSFAQTNSSAVVQLTGALNTAGTGTTNLPQILSQRTGATAVTTWNTSGTYYGVNADSGFTGSFFDFHVNGAASVASLSSTGFLLVSGNIQGSQVQAGGGFLSSFNGTASKAVVSLTGSVLSGGTGTTNVPQYLAQHTGATAVTTWSTSGTYFGVNADSGFVGNFADFHVNGASSVFTIGATGITTCPAIAPSGLTGATAAIRFVGGTTSGAPTTGTFAVGDIVFAQDGHIHQCTAAGSPGTWRQIV